VLSDLSLSVATGEIVALIGRSGSGKSTLLNLIAGIDLPTAGTVRIGGVDITALSERDRTLYRRANIGLVYQFFNLIPTLTVEENVRLPLELNGSHDRRPVRALLGKVDLLDRAGSFPDRLSGGEQQRVALARALVHKPSLVLADEPTGSLDQETGARILQLLEGLARDSGTTLIMVTHSEETSAIADRILKLENGRLARERLGP